MLRVRNERCQIGLEQDARDKAKKRQEWRKASRRKVLVACASCYYW